ncbi:MAG: hypothetical protein Kow00122_13180 [Thermoleophilia bacterium]
MDIESRSCPQPAGFRPAAGPPEATAPVSRLRRYPPEATAPGAPALEGAGTHLQAPGPGVGAWPAPVCYRRS